MNTKIKVAVPEGGESKLEIEEKVKGKFDDLDGWEYECKMKNDGKLAAEFKWNMLKVSRKHF